MPEEPAPYPIRGGADEGQAPNVGLCTLMEQGLLVEVLPQHVAEPMPVTLLYAHRRHLLQRVQAFMAWLTETTRPYLDA